MHFTREPIIETIITPKEGYKISIKNSKGGSAEEYLVDAVEVISFGQTFFYRSLERPKSFLLPVSDYELSEVKELRLVVKNPTVDKLIKIAGGKETAPHYHQPAKQAKVQQPQQQPQQQHEEEGEEEPKLEGAATPAAGAAKRDRKRQRRGKRVSQEEKGALAKESAPGEEVLPLAPVIFSSLLTPPDTLISDTLFRPKETTVKNLETPMAEPGSIHDFVEDYHDPLFSAPLVMEKEDQGLVSEEPRRGEHLEDHHELMEEIPDSLNDHTHLH